MVRSKWSVRGEVYERSVDDGRLILIVAKEPYVLGGWPRVWHISISHSSRIPTWKEISDARYEFVPNEIMMAMMLPPKEEYVNIHNFCMHLWEIEHNAQPA